MISRFKKVQMKLVCMLEGGYNLKWLGKCFLSQIGQLSDNPLKIVDESKERLNVDIVIKKLQDEFGKYWNI